MKKSFINRLSFFWHHENAIPTFMLALACLYWLSKCGSSLSLDETITYWVVQDGFKNAIYRAIHYQGPGPFYYLIVWLFVQLGGYNEIMLRLPSILSYVLLFIVLFRFSCKIFDRSSAFLVVIVFVCLDETFTYFVIARPYALALLLLVSSTYTFYCWIESNERRQKFFYIFFSTLTSYSHCIFTAILIVHLIYLCYRWKWVKNRSMPAIHEIIKVYLYIAVLISPGAYELMLITERKNILSFVASPSAIDLIRSLVKPYFIISLISGALATWIITKNIYIDRFTIRRDLLVLLLSWYLLPSLLVFLYSSVSGVSIFAPRYYSWGLPALSLLLGKGLNLIKPARSKRIMLIILFGLMLVYGGLQSPFNENWSSAIAYAKTRVHGSNIPVAAYTGLVESRDTSWVIHPERRKYLLSPFAVYRLDKEPFLLPATFDQPGAVEYLEKAVFPELRKVNQFYLILRMTYIVVNKSALTSDDYLVRQMELAGFHPKLVECFGHVKVISFEKN